MIDTLLDKRLIACANMLGSVTSYYRWEGVREKASEVAVLMKTTTEMAESTRAFIHQAHSYECPCVVVWPISDSSEEYLQWVNDETGLP